MKVWSKTKRWTKKHNEALLLTGTILAVLSIVISVGLYVVQNQAAAQDRRILQSEVNAAFGAISAIQHGANAAIFQRPNGLYSVDMSQGFNENLSLGVSFSAVITCPDGTQITSGSCPREFPAANWSAGNSTG